MNRWDRGEIILAATCVTVSIIACQQTPTDAPSVQTPPTSKAAPFLGLPAATLPLQVDARRARRLDDGRILGPDLQGMLRFGLGVAAPRSRLVGMGGLVRETPHYREFSAGRARVRYQALAAGEGGGGQGAARQGIEEFIALETQGGTLRLRWQLENAIARVGVTPGTLEIVANPAAAKGSAAQGSVVALVEAPWARNGSGEQRSPQLLGHGDQIELVLEDLAPGSWLIDPIWIAGVAAGVPRFNFATAQLGDGSLALVGGEDASGPLAVVERYDMQADTWAVTATLASPRAGATATLLQDESLLVVGGRGPVGPLSSTERSFNGAQVFSTGPSLATAREGHTATLLRDGRLLIAGGFDAAAVPLSSTEIYDPASGNFAPGPMMSAARAAHTASLLADGRVLLSGGRDAAGELSSCDLFDPSTNQLSAAGSLGGARQDHSATVLYDGSVLVVGGSLAGIPLPLAERFTPGTGLWVATQGSPVARARHQASLLPDGTVLLSGGLGSAGVLASSELFDPSTGSFVPGTSMGGPRLGHASVLLPSGRVRVLGGFDGALARGGSFSFRQGQQGWQNTGSMMDARESFGAARLADGRVLVVGGTNGNGDLDTTALYDPAGVSSAGTFTASAVLSSVRISARAVAVGNQVVVAGGDDGFLSLSSVELWSAGSFSPLPSMLNPRVDFSLVKLQDGSVLAIGGDDGVGAIDSVEQFTLGGSQWSPRAKLKTPRRKLRALVLADGSVLAVGGKDSIGRLATAERYSPLLNSWSSAGSMADPRSKFSLTLLQDGRVLAAGGDDGNGAIARCSLYSPATNSWSPAGSMNTARLEHVAGLLPDGRVLVAGGEDGKTSRTVFQSAEIYDPTTNSWSPVSSMASQRRKALAMPLSSGALLVMGGKDNNGTFASAELYDLGSGGAPVWAPTLVAPAPSFPGAILNVAGTGFMGASEAGSGTNGQGRSNLPLLRLSGPTGVQSFAEVHAYTDTGATLHLSSTLPQGSYQLEVIVAGSASAPVSLSLGVPPPGPQQLKVLSAPQTISVGACSGTVLVELQDANGIALANAVSSTVITPSAIPAGLGFFSDASCMTPLGSLTIPAQQTLGTFYFSGSTAGSVILLLSANGFPTQVQNELIVAGAIGSLAFTTPPVVAAAGSCAGPVTLQHRDATGVPAAVSVDSTISIQSSLGQLGIFNDSSCTVPIGAGLILSAGTIQGSVFVSGALPGSGTLQATMSGVQGSSQSVTISAGIPASLRISSVALQAPVASCVGPVRVSLEDAGGNPATAAAGLTLVLGVVPPSALNFYATASCVNGVTTLTVPAGQDGVDLYFSGLIAGAATLSATDGVGALGTASQTETLLAGPAAALRFAVQPSASTLNGVINPAIELVAEDAYGNRAAGQAQAITVALGNNPSSAKLAGTLAITSSAGRSLFSDLSLDRAGTGYTLVASAGGLPSVESLPFDITGGSGAVDPNSPVSASAGSAEACASQGVFLTLTVEPRALDGSPLPAGRSVSLVEDVPFWVAGAVRELPGSPARYEVEVGSNRCGSARTPQLQVDGVTLTQVPMVTFSCPAMQSTGFSFSAQPAVVPADGQTMAAVTVTLLDRCDNPAFGRPVTLEATDPALNVSVSPASATSSDTPGLPTDGSARFELASTDAGVTGVAAHVQGITGVSAGDLVTFSLGEVLKATLGADKQSVVTGETLALSLVLESSYTGSLKDLVVTLDLTALEVLNVQGAQQLADGSLVVPSLNPRGRLEIGLTAQVKSGFPKATAQATVGFSSSSGLRRETNSNGLEIAVAPVTQTGCECGSGSGGSRPYLAISLMGLFAWVQLRRRKRGFRR